MSLIIPPKLSKGDCIAVISPSGGHAGLFPHRIEKGINFLKKEGFKIKEFKTTRKIMGWSSGTPEERAADLMNAFIDENIKGIICTIGGYSANQLLPLLDYENIKKHPKLFCGYSDISVLHYALYQKSQLQTFYGPSIMVQFAEFPKPLDYTWDYFKKATVENKPIGNIASSEKWTDELLNWATKEDQKRARKLETNKGYEWLRNGQAEGCILGGCLSSIIHLRGTDYWPDHKNKILFIEIPEGQEFGKGEPLSVVESYLMDLKLSKVFDSIIGLIIGRPFKYSEEDNDKLKKIIIEMTAEYKFPILFGADIGHTDPQITIPFGALTQIDSEKNKFEINN